MNVLNEPNYNELKIQRNYSPVANSFNGNIIIVYKVVSFNVSC